MGNESSLAMSKGRVIRAIALFGYASGAFLSSNAIADAFSIANACGSLVGKAAACGVRTDTLSRRCGQKIDQATTGNPEERSRAVKQFVNAAEMSAIIQKSGGNEPCSSIQSEVSMESSVR